MMIPKEVKTITQKLNRAGFEAYIVGGCVRDMLREKKPLDWDIATSAKPKEVQKLFPKSFYDNQFGTVGVLTGSKDKSLEVVEVTTFRTEAKYSDRRHPDSIKFAKSIKEDLARRDFTINAMAYNPENKELIDLFGGREDLKAGLVRAVGEAEERFKEDALRLMRGVRFATVLDFTLEGETLKAIQKNAPLLEEIAKERVKEELEKIIMSERAHFGIMYLHEAGLLKYIMPELERGIGITQNHHHPYDCFYHGVYSLEYAALNKYSLELRLAALLHDIGKPYVKEGLGSRATFYNHAQYGAKVTETLLRRLKFSRKVVEQVSHLVRFHLFYYDADVVTESGVRRLLRRIGKENAKDFIKLRMADRIGSRVPKAKPYRLRHLEYMFEKVAEDPIDPTMLKIDGNEVMALCKIEPGPRVGLLLEGLLQEVLDDPKRNKKTYLKKRVLELNSLSDKELKKKAEKVYKFKEEREQERKAKYWVK